MGNTLLFDLYSMFNPTQRRLDRKGYSAEKARAQAALDEIESEQGFRQLEDPREQKELKQSLFGRGLGKSSIATQNTARLSDIQARRRASLGRQRDLALRGLDLIRYRRKAARRLLPLQIYGMVENKFGEAAGALAGMPGGEE